MNNYLWLVFCDRVGCLYLSIENPERQVITGNLNKDHIFLGFINKDLGARELKPCTDAYNSFSDSIVIFIVAREYF